jgi:hypothetical protein
VFAKVTLYSILFISPGLLKIDSPSRQTEVPELDSQVLHPTVMESIQLQTAFMDQFPLSRISVGRVTHAGTKFSNCLPPEFIVSRQDLTDLAFPSAE